MRLLGHSWLRVRIYPVHTGSFLCSKGSFTLQTEPNRTDSACKTNLRYEMEAFTLHAERSWTEPDRAWPSVFTGWCLFSLASRRPILLRSSLTSWSWSACYFYNECKYTGLRSFDQCAAFKTGFVGTKWQKTIKTETLNLNYGKKWLLNVTRVVSKNIIFLFIYWNSVMSCVEGIIQK